MGELHLTLNQLGSGSISCLRPGVKTERLVRSNERQDHRSDLCFLCEHTVTDPMYLEILEQFVYPQVSAFQPSIIYQQDWAPPLWNMDVRGSLNSTFPNLWIRRDGPICWPPRSLDQTLLNFFLWGYVKDRVFATPWRDCYNPVTSEMLTRTLQEFEYRLDIVCATNGANVDVY